jgi:hypothetical protein
MDNATAQSWSNQMINVGPDWAPSEYDDLEVAPGRKIGQISTPELTAIFERLNVTGFSHTAGRDSNIRAFAAERQRVFSAAGNAAVNAWIGAA